MTDEEVEDEWKTAGTDERGRRLLRCPTHGKTFTALNPCARCLYDNPPLPPDLEIPSYWIEHPYGRIFEGEFTGMDFNPPAGPGRYCTFHHRHLRLSEACARCIEEDDLAASE